jgi:hypothetical protein
MTALLNAVSVLFKTFSLAIIRLRSLKKKRFPGAFIISVDNLSFGGTGKTSLVMDIGRELERKKAKFAIVSRGYRSRFEKKGTPVSRDHQPHEVGDEAALIKRAFSRQDIFIGRNRNRSIENALENGNRFIILDDGFQSAGIEKDLKIMLLNPGHPYYYLRNFRWLAGQEDVVLSLRSGGNIPSKPPGSITGSNNRLISGIAGFWDSRPWETTAGSGPAFHGSIWRPSNPSGIITGTAGTISLNWTNGGNASTPIPWPAPPKTSSK